MRICHIILLINLLCGFSEVFAASVNAELKVYKHLIDYGHIESADSIRSKIRADEDLSRIENIQFNISTGYLKVHQGENDSAKYYFKRAQNKCIRGDSMLYYSAVRGMALNYSLTEYPQESLIETQRLFDFLKRDSNVYRFNEYLDAMLEDFLAAQYTGAYKPIEHNEGDKIIWREYNLKKISKEQYNLYKSLILFWQGKNKEALDTLLSIEKNRVSTLKLFHLDAYHFLLGVYYTANGKTERALDQFEYLKVFMNKRAVSISERVIYFQMGLCYYKRLDYKNSYNNFQLADDKSKSQLSEFDLVIKMYKGITTSNFDDTLSFQILRNAAYYGELIPINDYIRYSLVYINNRIAGSYYRTGAIDQHNKHLQSAINISEKQPQLPKHVIYTYYLECKYFYRNWNYTDLLKSSTKALNYYNSLNDIEKKYLEYNRLFEINSLQNYKSVALYHLSRVNENSTSNLISSINLQMEIIHKRLSQIQYKRDDPGKFKTLAQLDWNYKNLIRSIVRLHQIHQTDSLINNMIKYMWQCKSTMFKAKLNEEEALKFSNIPESKIVMERGLKDQIAELTNSLTSDNLIVENKEKIILEIRDTKEKYDSLLRAIENKYPFYKRLKSEEPTYTVGEVQSKLPENSALLNYLYLYDTLLCISIRPDTVVVSLTKTKDNFISACKKYQKQITSYNYGDFSPLHFREFVTASSELYKVFIEPVEDIVKNKRIIVVPYAETNLVPLETLVKPDTNNYSHNWATLPYLVKTNPVNTIYALEQLDEDEQTISKHSSFAGFASSYQQDCPESDSLETFDVLNGAVDEVKSGNNFFRGKTYTGNRSSEKRFFGKAAKADVVHLAMHTKVDDRNPTFSKLVFSQDCSKEENNLLHIYEIYRRPFKGKLWVLSGCNTGSGKISRGEGVINLAKNFFYNGISNIILTQWAVADKSSARLMELFYEELGKGMYTDVALQQAKIRYLKTQDPVKLHPYYWSGYASVGLPVEYVSEKGLNKKSMIWIISGSALFVLLILVLLKKSKFYRSE